MVATASTQRFFRKAAAEGEENTNEWHAYRDDGTASLCGEAQLAYNVDPISDAVPSNGVLHLGCREALAVEQQPQAEAEAAAAAEARAAAEAEAASTETTDDQTVTGDDVADLNATLGEGEPEAGAPEAPAEAPAEETPAEAPAEGGEVIDGDDGTAATPEPDPVP